MALKEDLSSRFWRKVDKGGPGGCWLWTANKNRGGYGFIKIDRRNRSAHRVAYELSVGPIPDGLTIDHLCRVRHCVNPAHLEVVTKRTNTLRGTSPSAVHARKTHCTHGHKFTPENTYHWRGGRKCRACHRRLNAKWRARRRVAA